MLLFALFLQWQLWALDGRIKTLKADKFQKEKLAKASPSDVPAVYAQAGIWYDALASLTDQIDAQPDNKALRHARVLDGFRHYDFARRCMRLSVH